MFIVLGMYNFGYRLKLRQLSSNSFSNSSVDENGESSKNRRNRRGIGSSKLKVITNNLANNWRLKSLQSKHERRERRATKTLAVVLGCFLFCWIPFFACNTLAAISIKWNYPDWRPGMTTFLITTWLGYFNSIINPFIYTIFNRDFRKAFRKIFGLDK